MENAAQPTDATLAPAQRAEHGLTDGMSSPARTRSAAELQAVREALRMLKDGDDVRAALVAAVRQSIGERAYINELKLAVAADRLAADLNRLKRFG